MAISQFFCTYFTSLCLSAAFVFFVETLLHFLVVIMLLCWFRHFYVSPLFLNVSIVLCLLFLHFKGLLV